MKLKQAHFDDEEQLYRIYQTAKEEMVANGIYQWNDKYPDRHQIHLDICQNNCFILAQGGIILAAVVLIYTSDGHTLDLKRLVVNSKYGIRGLASQMMKEVFQWAERYHVVKIRSTTNHTNFKMIHLFEKFGFERVNEYLEPQRAQFGSFITFEKKGEFDYGNHCNGQPQYRYGDRHTTLT